MFSFFGLEKSAFLAKTCLDSMQCRDRVIFNLNEQISLIHPPQTTSISSAFEFKHENIQINGKMESIENAYRQ